MKFSLIWWWLCSCMQNEWKSLWGVFCLPHSLWSLALVKQNGLQYYLHHLRWLKYFLNDYLVRKSGKCVFMDYLVLCLLQRSYKKVLSVKVASIFILRKSFEIDFLFLPYVEIWPSTTLYLNNKGKIKKSILKDFLKMQIEVTFTLKSFL
jgi:hypothetical protein